MEITLTAIKADVGSIGGHLAPSRELVARVEEVIAEDGKDLLCDHFIGHTGDDIAILMSHEQGRADARRSIGWPGTRSRRVPRWRRPRASTGPVRTFSRTPSPGTCAGSAPAVAELSFEERESEPFLLFTADKTEPGAYNLPLYLAFADPMYNSGLILSPGVGRWLYVRHHGRRAHTRGQADRALNA